MHFSVCSRRALALLLFVCLFLSFSVSAAAVDTAQPDTGTPAADAASAAPDDTLSVDAGAALLYEMNSGTVLYAKNDTESIYPASLAKILTCLVALENGNLTDMVTVSKSALSSVEQDLQISDFQEGETLSLESLLYDAMLASSNEACSVIAEHISGSIDDFVSLLNTRAKELGCTGSHFANPHGLHSDTEYTTLQDLLLITKAALAREDFRTIAFSTRYEIPATNLHEARQLYTTNYLTSTDRSSKYYYEYAKGVKTGYTSKAGRCLITTAEKGSLSLLSIVVGCETTQEEDGEYTLHNFPESKKLLEYGFDHFASATVLSPLVPLEEVAVNGGDRDSVVIAPVEEVSVILPKDYDASKITTSVSLDGGSVIEAPVQTGDPVGTVSVYYDGALLETAQVAPITDVGSGNSQASSADAAAQTGRSASTLPLLLGLVFAFLILIAFIVSRVLRKKPARKTPANKRKKRSTL